MSVATADRPGGAAASLLSAARTHLGVAGAQWFAGVGNLVFALVVARIVGPAAFADLGVFLGGYVLLHVPAAGIGAGAALDPTGQAERRRRFTRIGIGAGLVLAAGAPVLADLLAVPLALTVVLAAAAPGAALLGLERGHLFGTGGRRRVAGSLVAEPLGRLGLGLAAATVAGAVGAAAVVTLAGYAALAVARTGVPAAADLAADAGRTASRSATTATFVLFALVQQQDLFVANARLAPDVAGLFAAVSTAGGAVAFATATIPMTLLPTDGRSRGSNGAALGLTVAVGLGATLVAVLAGGDLLAAAFGEPYRAGASWLAPYVAAMSLFGVARVLAARRCAGGEHRPVLLTVALVVALHVGLLVAFGGTPAGVVAATAAATVAGVGSLALPGGSVGRWWRRTRTAVAGWISVGDLAVVGVFAAVAAAIRSVSARGLWVDEAITVAQARMPLGGMIDQLGTTDVHPPLHHVLVWLTVRVAGTSELAVRAPSVVAGVALVPVAFGLANALYGRRTALVSAAFVTVAPFAVWYSQEARMYSLFMVLATAAFWAQVSAIRGGGRWAWAAYALTTAGMAWTQWFAVVVVVAQQLVFAGVFLQRRNDRIQRRRLLAGWAAAVGAVVVLVLPLLPLGLEQLDAYLARRGAEAPATAGASASGIASGISVYAVGANALWAVLGYHSDRTMTVLAALWPLLLLAGLGALGRGRSRPTTALLACIVVPAIAFVALGTYKRDLFELRYFAAVVPLLMILAARVVTSVWRRPAAQFAAAGVAVAVLAGALVDQQLNGANPRRYDFEGALARVTAQAEPGDVVLYEPDYLGDVIDYYAPEVDARPIGRRRSVDTGTGTFVVATSRVVDSKASAARVGDALADLEQGGRDVVDRFEVPNVRVWELRDA